MAEYKVGRCFVFRLPHKSDLLAEITRFVQENDIRCAQINCIGATYNGIVGFFDHDSGEYVELTYDCGLEISAAIGNVSIKDGAPFVHLHLVLTDDKGNTTGGHVMPGIEVLACEVTITEFVGPELTRVPDDETGLTLWPE